MCEWEPVLRAGKAANGIYGLFAPPKHPTADTAREEVPDPRRLVSGGQEPGGASVLDRLISANPNKTVKKDQMDEG